MSIKITRDISIIIFIGLFLLSYSSIIQAAEDKNNEIIKAVLNKVVEDYKYQINSYGKEMPLKVSIALVEQQFDRGDPLEFCKNVKKHWLYENGSISESVLSVREKICQDRTDLSYPYRRLFSIVTFAIFTKEDKATVQLDENWFAQNGEGALYEVIKESNGKISLKILNGLWVS